MDRGYIDRYLVVDRYVAGDLSERELGDFEERLVWDRDLVDEVDLAEKLRRGLEVAGRKEAPAPRRAGAWLYRLHLAAAASFVLGIMSASLFFGGPGPLDGGGSPGTSVVELDVVRGGAEQQIVVPPDTFVVLMVAVEAGYPSYSAAIRKKGTPEATWSREGLMRGYAKSLAIGVPASSLPSGHYVLSVVGVSHQSDTIIREIAFEAVASD